MSFSSNNKSKIDIKKKLQAINSKVTWNNLSKNVIISQWKNWFYCIFSLLYHIHENSFLF